MPALRLFLLGSLDIRHGDQQLSKPPTVKSELSCSRRPWAFRQAEDTGKSQNQNISPQGHNSPSHSAEHSWESALAVGNSKARSQLNATRSRFRQPMRLNR